MAAFRLNEDTQKAIRTSTGMDTSFISKTDVDIVDQNIERHTGKKLTPAVSLAGIIPRGSVYLMFNRLFTNKEIDSKLAAVK